MGDPSQGCGVVLEVNGKAGGFCIFQLLIREYYICDTCKFFKLKNEKRRRTNQINNESLKY